MSARTDAGDPAMEWRLGRLESRPVAALVPDGPVRDAFLKASRICSFLSIGAAAVAALFLALIAIVMGGEIIGRNIGRPLPFSWEYGSYLMSAAFFWGGGFAFLSAGHVRVTFLLSPSAGRRTQILEATATAVGVAVTGVVALALVDAAMQFASRGTTSYTTMQTPLVIPSTAVAVGACITWLQLAGRLLGLLAGRIDTFVLKGGSAGS